MTQSGVDIDYRALTSDDLGLLLAVPAGVFDDPIDEKRAREFLEDPRHHLVVAIVEGEIAGFVSAVDYLHPDKPVAELWINEVSVSANHRGKGIGKELIRQTMLLDHEIGCREAWVLADPENTAATSLYESANGGSGSKQLMFDFDLTN